MRKIRSYLCYNIDYDTDGMKLLKGLPPALIIHLPSDISVEYEGADTISDKTGFCVNGFDYVELKDNTKLVIKEKKN